MPLTLALRTHRAASTIAFAVGVCLMPMTLSANAAPANADGVSPWTAAAFRQPPADPGDAPCQPEIARSIDRRVLPADEALEAEVTIDYACKEELRRMAVMVVVESTDALRPPGFMGRNLLGNLRDGLTNFVDEMDWQNGSMGGFITYGASSTVHTDLQGGAGGRQALRSAVSTFPQGGGRSAAGVTDAIESAVDELDTADDELYRLILLVDAGADLEDVEGVTAACEAARGEGIHVSVYGLEGAADRLRECADPHLFRGSGREGGQDIPDHMTEYGQGMARGDQISAIEITDRLSPEFSYVAGSGTPEEPFEFVNELIWDVTDPATTAGLAFTYGVEPSGGTVDAQADLSESAVVDVSFGDGRLFTYELENPEICVHPPGSPGRCDGFVASPTPEVTATATEAPPTATVTPDVSASPTPEPTEVDAGLAIYLPLCLNREEL